MDELWVRVGLVALMLVVAISVAVWLRREKQSPIRDISSGDLMPGVYLFTSESCPTCALARAQLSQALEDATYIEVRWEDHPGKFVELGVDAVPAILIVKVPGIGKLYPGQPERVLAEL